MLPQMSGVLRAVLFMAFGISLAAGLSQAATITYGPVLAPVDPPGGGQPVSAVVYWKTDTATASNAAFAGPGSAGPWLVTAQDAAAGTRHEALLTGLTPGANYYVYVVSDGVASAPVEFRTGENLLTNGSLETWHAVTGQGWGAEEPDGWHGWEIYPWTPAGSNNPDHITIQKDRPTAAPTPAFKDGQHRAGMDEGWRSCYGGIYQTVSGLAPGEYDVSAWVSWLFNATTFHDRHLVEIIARDGAHAAGVPPSGTTIFRQYSPGSEGTWQLASGTVNCASGSVTLYANLRSDNYDGASFAHFDALRLMAKAQPAVTFSGFQASRVINGGAYDVTITYQTDVPVTTMLDWGPTAAYGASTPLDAELRTIHAVTIVDVAPSPTAFHYRAQATAPGGVEEYSADQTFEAPALSFSAVTAAVEPRTGRICTVSWSTSHATADNRLYYRPSGASQYIEAVEPAGASPLLSHSVTITGLDLGATYEFYVFGASPDIIAAQSSVRTFTTPAEPALADLLLAMSMIGGPLAAGGDDVGPAAEVQRMIQTDLDVINRTGSLGYSWPQVQPDDPGDGPNVYDWSAGDARLPSLIPGKARGSYFQMYGCTPSWLTQDTPRFWEKFEQFVEAMTIHINQVWGDVDYTFENEPNISRAPSGWNWADWYIHCLQHFYVAVHRADAVTGRTNRVIAGNLAGHSAGGFAELYARGLKNCSDVLGYHPYPYDLRDGLEVADLAQIHAIQEQYGDAAKKIYVSEGWGSGRSAGFDRSSPTIPPPAEEVENMYLAMVNGWDNVMTPRQHWDPAYLDGMSFFCGNDNWGARKWRSRAVPVKDSSGNITGFMVDGYHMTPDIAPQFWNGGMLDWYGNSKDCLLHVFPGNGLVFMNPGFELASSPPRAHQPHFWKTPVDPAPASDYSLDDSVCHGGSRSLKLSRASAGSAYVSQMTAKRTVLPGLPYTARVWVKTGDSPSLAARFYLLFASLDGTQKSAPVFAQDVPGASGWRQVEVTASAPSFASRAETGCILTGAGTAWFDDVTISLAGQDETGTVRGYTLDEEQQPVPNCLVRSTTGGCQTVSDGHGFYELANVPCGTYDFVCRKTGYVPSRITNQTVAAGKLTLVSYHMGIVKPGLTVTDVSAAAPLALAGTQTAVTVTVRNEKPYPVMVSEVGCFIESGGADATGDFGVSPSPANPKVIPPLSALPFSFALSPEPSAAGRQFSVNAYAFGQEDRPNLLANGGFDFADPFYHWGMWGSSSVCNWIADSAEYVSAPRSLKNVASDPGGDRFNWAGNYSAWGAGAVPAKPDTNYIVGAYHKDITSGRVALNLYIEEFYYDGSSHFYNGRHFAAVPRRSVWANDSMIYLTGDPAETPGLYATNRLRVSVGSYIGEAGASTTAWWDDVYLKEEGDWLADDRADEGADVIVPREVSSIAEARSAAPGEFIRIAALVVTAGDGVFDGRIYAEQADRAAGVLLIPASGPLPPSGASVTVAGRVGALDGEPAIDQATITQTGEPGLPLPLSLNARATADGGVTTLGLLVTLGGRVSHSSPDGAWFTVDDGSEISDGAGHRGLKVLLPPGAVAPPEGAPVAVTGISSCANSGALPVLRVRSAEDVRAN
jgi:hypothetical protein